MPGLRISIPSYFSSVRKRNMFSFHRVEKGLAGDFHGKILFKFGSIKGLRHHRSGCQQEETSLQQTTTLFQKQAYTHSLN